MKTFARLLAGFVCLGSALAAEPVKPLVTLTVKRQVIDSDHDLRGKQGSSKERTIALRVEITNTSDATIEGAELAGTALVSRAGDLQDKIVREPLGPMKVPAMKPNERLSLDLGKLRLTELELRGRKFEETLEEWKVACVQGGREIGQAVSSERYAALAQQIAPRRQPGPLRRQPRP